MEIVGAAADTASRRIRTWHRIERWLLVLAAQVLLVAEPLRLRVSRIGPVRATRVASAAFVVVLVLFAVVRVLAIEPWVAPAFDLWAYWTTRFGLDYAAAHPGQTGAYLYSPAFANLIAPLTALPWPVFAGLWTFAVGLPLLWLAGRYAVALGMIPVIAMSIGLGQLDLAFAAVTIVGLRWPAVWALPILTKVTPVIGLVWFLVRREWASLGIAVAATLAIAAVSFAADPGSWLGWFQFLGRLEFPKMAGGLIMVPVDVWVRLPLAIGLIAWGALTDRRWTIPVSVCLALPTVFVNSPTILVAVLPLVAAGARTPAAAWLARGQTGPKQEPGRHGRSTRTGRTT